ncbi:MAG: threonylcarbamoyl-AMP synthase [Alphaproteobacteria bacterium]|nr:threonylcarbamoyl-AMP synthase [Alphaproteobacteria bacterium]
MILKPTKENIRLITEKLLNGDVIIFPTDTVFGIGCIATNTKAIEKIYKLKGREKTKSLLLNVANITTIKKFAKVSKLDNLLIKKFMPGALSLILNVKNQTPLSHYVIKDNKVGIRIPNNQTLLKILKKIKLPLISTSCNLSGKPACINAKDAEKIFGKDIIILDSYEKLSGLSSTIIDTTEKEIKYIREGKIKFKEIKKIISQSFQ